MPNTRANNLDADGLTFVMLRLDARDAEKAKHRMNLASVNEVLKNGQIESICFGPNRWVLTSESLSAAEILVLIGERLASLVYHATDYASALESMTLKSKQATEIIASGTGLDIRPEVFKDGDCARTRLANIPVIIIVRSENHFNLLVGYGYRRYLSDWLADAAEIADLVKA